MGHLSFCLLTLTVIASIWFRCFNSNGQERLGRSILTDILCLLLFNHIICGRRYPPLLLRVANTSQSHILEHLSGTHLRRASSPFVASVEFYNGPHTVATICYLTSLCAGLMCCVSRHRHLFSPPVSSSPILSALHDTQSPI